MGIRVSFTLDQANIMAFLKSILLLFALFAASSSIVEAEQNWYSFQVHWTPLVFDGFVSQPRTAAEAEAAGWQLVSNDCSEGASFPGVRYAPVKDNGPDMVVIYDVNGFIAGMHSVVLKKYSSGNWQSDSTWYRTETIFGEEAYLTTAYFVSPEIICTGRTQAEFDVDGTGNILLFQNGPTSQDVIQAPPDLDSTAGTPWYRHFCFVNMGRHYFQLNYDTNAPCDSSSLVPIQLVYSGGVLNGFVWQHVARLPGDLWEEVNGLAISQIIDRPPDCFYDLAVSPGITTMHTYLRNYGTLCIDDKKQDLMDMLLKNKKK